MIIVKDAHLLESEITSFKTPLPQHYRKIKSIKIKTHIFQHAHRIIASNNSHQSLSSALRINALFNYSSEITFQFLSRHERSYLLICLEFMKAYPNIGCGYL